MKRTITILMTLLLALQVNALSIDLEPSCEMMQEMSHDDMGHHMMSDMDNHSEPMPEECCDGNCECELMATSHAVALLNDSLTPSLANIGSIPTQMFTLIEGSQSITTPPPNLA